MDNVNDNSDVRDNQDSPRIQQQARTFAQFLDSIILGRARARATNNGSAPPPPQPPITSATLPHPSRQQPFNTASTSHGSATRPRQRDEDLPDLLDASDSSASDEAMSVSVGIPDEDADNHDVEMDTSPPAVRDHDRQRVLETLFPVQRAPSSSEAPRIGIRRARVEDDHDELGDYVPPPPPSAQSFSPFSTPGASGSTIPNDRPVRPLPRAAPPHPVMPQANNPLFAASGQGPAQPFDVRTLFSSVFGAGPPRPAPPPTASVSPNTAPPPNTINDEQAPHGARPNPFPSARGVAFTFNAGEMPHGLPHAHHHHPPGVPPPAFMDIAVGFFGSLPAGGPPRGPLPPGMSGQGTRPAPPPGAPDHGEENRPEPQAMPPFFEEMLRAMFGGTMGMMGPEREDPERAQRLVDALEVVPHGLVRRLEKVGGAQDENGTGDAGCAVCWDKLLDGDGEGFGVPTNENIEGGDNSASSEPVLKSEQDSNTAEVPKIVSLPCAHVFHASCLLPWFSRPRHTTCPTCRFNIDPENLTYRPLRQVPTPAPNAAGRPTAQDRAAAPATTATERPAHEEAPLEAAASSSPAESQGSEGMFAGAIPGLAAGAAPEQGSGSRRMRSHWGAFTLDPEHGWLPLATAGPPGSPQQEHQPQQETQQRAREQPISAATTGVDVADAQPQPQQAAPAEAGEGNTGENGGPRPRRTRVWDAFTFVTPGWGAADPLNGGNTTALAFDVTFTAAVIPDMLNGLDNDDGRDGEEDGGSRTPQDAPPEPQAHPARDGPPADAFAFFNQFLGGVPRPDMSAGAQPRPWHKKEWSLPPAPGLTLRQRVEKKEREAGLRCWDVSCGVGPTDEDPLLSEDTLAAALERQVSIRGPAGGEGARACEHTFHPPCLVTAERVAGWSGGDEDGLSASAQVEVACPICRAMGHVGKEEWDAGVQALV